MGGGVAERVAAEQDIHVGGARVFLSAQDAELIQRAESGIDEPYALYLLNRQAQSLSLRPTFETLVAPELAHAVIPYDHQLNTVRRVLSRMRGRALLCDEVGLGKTIEAGLILLELLVRGLVRSVLILTPPGLVGQWQHEMASKFHQQFTTSDEESFRSDGPEAWHRHPRIIASLALAKRDPHAAAILSRAFDLLIVDETYHLRNRTTLAWQFVRQIRTRYCLLLTATPVQNHLEELHNLVSLLAPGQIGTLKAFRHQHLERSDPLTPRDPVRLRELLAEVMIRNRRSTSGIRFTRRYATTLRVEPSAEEHALYQEVSRQVCLHYRSASGTQRLVWRGLQMALGSSPQAAASTLRTLAKSQSDPEPFLILAQRADQVTRPAKLDRLLELIRSTSEKLIVFTQYHASLSSIVAALEDAGLQPAVYHGRLTRRQRDAAIEQFRAEAPVLVSSESGSEGRNLQFCSSIVNFDLPWNPMRIEQRIGRISRIGQAHEVYVWNLCAAGTLEEHLLHLLEAKIHLFELVIGEIDMILGRLEEERDFDALLMDLWAQAESEQQFAQSLDALAERLNAAKQAYLRTRELEDRLFGDALKAS
jgi:SNF2 family DNA or RNA helicase